MNDLERIELLRQEREAKEQARLAREAKFDANRVLVQEHLATWLTEYAQRMAGTVPIKVRRKDHAVQVLFGKNLAFYAPFRSFVFSGPTDYIVAKGAGSSELATIDTALGYSQMGKTNRILDLHSLTSVLDETCADYLDAVAKGKLDIEPAVWYQVIGWCVGIPLALLAWTPLSEAYDFFGWGLAAVAIAVGIGVVGGQLWPLSLAFLLYFIASGDW